MSGEDSDAKDFDMGFANHVRVGTRFGCANPDKAHTVRDRFRWLNEAITESLTLKLLENDLLTTLYAKEQELLSLFAKSGAVRLEDKVLQRPYFENYDPNAYPTVPAWKEFMRWTETAYRPRFLQDLDAFVDEEASKRLRTFSNKIGAAFRRIQNKDLRAQRKPVNGANGPEVFAVY